MRGLAWALSTFVVVATLVPMTRRTEDVALADDKIAEVDGEQPS